MFVLFHNMQYIPRFLSRAKRDAHDIRRDQLQRIYRALFCQALVFLLLCAFFIYLAFRNEQISYFPLLIVLFTIWLSILYAGNTFYRIYLYTFGQQAEGRVISSNKSHGKNSRGGMYLSIHYAFEDRGGNSHSGKDSIHYQPAFVDMPMYNAGRVIRVFYDSEFPVKNIFGQHYQIGKLCMSKSRLARLPAAEKQEIKEAESKRKQSNFAGNIFLFIVIPACLVGVYMEQNHIDFSELLAWFR